MDLPKVSGNHKEVLHIYVVLNPVAGHSTADEIHELLVDRFQGEGYDLDIYETTGEEDVAQLTQDACKRGSKLVIAAGGDGTVAGVVNGLLHTEVPLGIIPVGTGNGLARALNLPLDVAEAVELIAGDHQTQHLDALKVGDEYYILNVSAGISAVSMNETPVESKRKFGVLAYAWTIVKQLFGFQPRRFWLTVDNHRVQVRASEILISNGTLLRDQRPLGPPELFNDGIMDIYILTTRNLLNYLSVIWHFLVHGDHKRPYLRHLTSKNKVRIDAYSTPLPTQADGEPLGRTPVDVEIVPDAIQVVVPKPEPKENGG